MTGEKKSTEAQETIPHTLDELKHTRTIDTIHQDEALRVLAYLFLSSRMDFSITTKPCCRKRWVILIIMFTLTRLMFLGALWSARGSSPRCRQPVLLLRIDLLLRLHCRKLSRHPDGTTLAN
jgi:hypothetical protein